jgi:hypothetical protein
MSKQDPTGESPRHLVAQAERQLAAYGEELDAVLEDIRAGKFGTPRDMAVLASSLRKALEAVFSERARLERLVHETGRQGGGELDLAAAGDEVRRRMARLRAAQREGGVPEQPE